MKIAVDIGHNSKYGAGAHGFLDENTCCMEVGTRLIKKLRDAGHTVVETLPPPNAPEVINATTSLKYRTDKANREKVDFFCCIHFNAMPENAKNTANGTEVWVYDSSGEKLATPVLNAICKALGSKNRGIKTSTGLYVLRHTTMPAYLIECLFVDSEIDYKLYNADKLAEAIFFGITGKPSAVPVVNNVPGVNTPSDQLLTLQKALNAMGYTDKNGNKLVEDGFSGPLTDSAIEKLDKYLHAIIGR